jgi:cell division protein FtsW (lipid II flippase)
MNSQQPAQDHERDSALMIAKRAGLAVIAMGLVDLVCCIVSAPAGTVNLKVGGLLVGLLMLFGGLRILAVVRWLSLLAVSVLLSELVTYLVFVPVSLTFTQMRLYPMAFAESCVPSLISLAIAVVAALRLSHPTVLAARERVGRAVHSARIPLILGLFLAAGASYFQYRILGGETAQRASRIVAEKMGPGYRYYTTSLSTTYGKTTEVHAIVQAWNKDEVRNIPVRWRE